jgi:hypothetical protein
MPGFCSEIGVRGGVRRLFRRYNCSGLSSDEIERSGKESVVPEVVKCFELTVELIMQFG